MRFGQDLRGLRHAGGLSRAEPAWRAEVPASTLRNWEGDRGFPGVQAGLRLAGALGVAWGGWPRGRGPRGGLNPRFARRPSLFQGALAGPAAGDQRPVDVE
jgi:hypothetical protein